MQLNTVKQIARRALGRSNAGYRFLFRRDHGVSGPNGYPAAEWSNAVLKSEQEICDSLAQVERLGLPPMAERAKNWDSLAALSLILKTTDRRAGIFDAGGEAYSMILPWLALYGYNNLTAGNLVFGTAIRRGPITYEYADITKTKYADETFDAITCLSVIEHGVDLRAYFKEMGRILRGGGTLITSTDYYDVATDTRGQTAYGVPIHIFTRGEILYALDLARQHGFSLISPIDLDCSERAVHWKKYDLRYTFVILSLRKTG
jgi:SAM-dependent methyltransferase